MRPIEQKTLEVIARSTFTYKGDSHFRTYRQGELTLNRLERMGLVKREDHDPSMYVLTPLAREAAKYPNVPLAEVAAWMPA